MKKTLLLSMVFLGACCAGAAMTAKTSWTQRWPWNTTVDIDFTLSGGEKCDVQVTASFTTNGVAGALDLEHAGLAGDVWELVPGTYHLSWDPAAAGLDVAELKNFSVAVTPVENATVARKWLVLTLADGSFEYVADEPDGGWNTDEYKRGKMVFRRIPAGTYTAGLAAEEQDYLKAAGGTMVGKCIPKQTNEITKDYYIAIFKCTNAQRERILDPASTENSASPSMSWEKAMLPHLRGSNNVDGIVWPDTKFAVKDGCIIDTLRKRFGGRFWIDLPTSAQWEKAARGGTDTFWPNGGTLDTSYEECTNLVSAIGLTGFNAGKDYATTYVGTYAPNQYGLYDTIGMRYEYVLDQFRTSSTEDTVAAETVDPVGPSDGTHQTVRSCHAIKTSTLLYCSPASFNYIARDQLEKNYQQAFRLAIHLRPPQSFGGKWK